jgi:hypothetical protein
MRIWRWILGGAATLVVLVAAGGAYMYTQQVNTREAGPPIGSPAPGFALPQATRGTVTLAELHRDGPVALLFYRSADW